MDTLNFSYDSSKAWLDIVEKQVASLRFGVVQIVVHEGRVTLIERTEKVRVNQHLLDDKDRKKS